MQLPGLTQVPPAAFLPLVSVKEQLVTKRGRRCSHTTWAESGLLAAETPWGWVATFSLFAI